MYRGTVAAFAERQQDGVAVEFTLTDRQAGKRVPGIVLHEDNQSARANHSLHLGEQICPLLRRHMMEDQSRHHQIEAVVAERQLPAIVGVEPRFGAAIRALGIDSSEGSTPW